MDIRWLLVLAFLLIVAERAVYGRFALSRLNYRRGFSAAIVGAGDAVQMIEVIENRKLLPLPWVVLEATFDVSLQFQNNPELNVRQTERYQNHRSYFSLRPYTRVTRRHQLHCPRRGVYQLDTAAMTCGDVFGLHSRLREWKLAGENTTLTVLPPIKPLDDLAFVAHSWQGDVTVRRWILPDPFLRAGSRLYQPGDPLHQINWPATARTAQLQVHQQEFTADYRMMIVLNFEVMENMWNQVTEPDRVEAGIVLAASLAAHFIDQGIAVGFLCNGRSLDSTDMEGLRPVAGEAQLHTLLLALAHLQMDVHIGIDDLLRMEVEAVQTNTDYILITGYLNPRMENQLEALRARGNTVETLDLPSAEQTADWLQTSSAKGELNRDAG